MDLGQILVELHDLLKKRRRLYHQLQLFDFFHLDMI